MTAYLAQSMDRTEVRLLLGTDCRTDRKIVARIGKNRIDPQRLEALCNIGNDEITFRRHPNHITAFADHLPRPVVWIGQGKNPLTPESVLSAIGPEPRREMETATLNHFHASKIILREREPQARIVSDRFHFRRLAGGTVDEVLRGRVRALDCLQLSRAKKARWNGLSWARRSRPKPFEKLATTVKRQKAAILCRKTSSLFTCRAFGLERAEPLDARFHPCSGGITLNPPLSFPTAIP